MGRYIVRSRGRVVCETDDYDFAKSTCRATANEERIPVYVMDRSHRDFEIDANGRCVEVVCAKRVFSAGRHV